MEFRSPRGSYKVLAGKGDDIYNLRPPGDCVYVYLLGAGRDLRLAQNKYGKHKDLQRELEVFFLP